MRNTLGICNNEAGLVGKFIGTAYDVVKRVYDSIDSLDTIATEMPTITNIGDALDELKSLYANIDKLSVLYDNLDDLAAIADGLQEINELYASLEEIRYIYSLVETKGFMISVNNNAELTALESNKVKYGRVISSTSAGYHYVDYAFIEGVLSGIPAHDSTTGSWVAIGSSTNIINMNSEVLYYTSTVGGETSITIDSEAIGVGAIYVNGSRQDPDYGFSYNPATKVVTLASPLEVNDFIVVLATGITLEGSVTLYDLLKSENGASVVVTTSGKTVQEELDELKTSNAISTGLSASNQENTVSFVVSGSNLSVVWVDQMGVVRTTNLV